MDFSDVIKLFEPIIGYAITSVCGCVIIILMDRIGRESVPTPEDTALTTLGIIFAVIRFVMFIVSLAKVVVGNY